MKPKDSFDRPLHDLRISVIDRCNFRCTYCMPEDEYSVHHTFLKEQEWLRFEEIIRLTKLFTTLGVSKVRITGGEPLLRPNLAHLIEKLNTIPGISDLTLTTNGSLLEKQICALKAVGLHRLTVSLDSLTEDVFREMNGQKGSVNSVLRGIDKAEEVGIKNIKINVVIQRGVNDHTVLDLIKYFKGSGHIIRFIEYMDVGNCNHWQREKVVPSAELVQSINQHYPIRPMEANYFGEVASRYEFIDGAGEIGFISSVTQPFCGHCTRVRLSTDGKIYTCLFASEGVDIRNPLRDGASDQELLAIIKNIWQHRSDKYSENRSLFQSLQEKRQKVEMYKIGG